MGNLDSGKLTSVDDHGGHINIIPAEVRGFYRRHRDWSQFFLLAIFLGLPWTTIGGHQTILLDIPNREFSLFGILFRAHDAPLLFFVGAALALGLAMVTAVWGRVWCGWACPQTVFIDAVYRRIEVLVEGNYIERRRLRDQPLDGKSFAKKFIKWILFVFVSALISHSFMAYFVGSKNLLAMIARQPSENLSYFAMTFIFSALILFNFAWFREQFCVIMCPYGRIQSLLIDPGSAAIVYDVARGEPRRSVAMKSGQKAGDCISCNRCVQVCPTGIDIRNGLQMDCIACTACADACDEVMDKVHKPRGLIGYKSLNGLKITWLRPRVLLYALGILILVGGLTKALVSRSSFDATLVRGGGMPYSMVKDADGDERVLNHFKLHIQNQSRSSAEFLMEIPQRDANLNLTLTVAQNPISLSPGQATEWHFFLSFPASALSVQGQLPLDLRIINVSEQESNLKQLILIGPRRP